MGAENGGVAAAAGKRPLAGNRIAAWDFDGRALDTGAPGQDSVRRAEQALGCLGRKVGGGHGATAALADAPGGAGVGGGNDARDLGQRHEIDLAAAEGFGKQQPEQAGRMQGCDHIGGQLAAFVDATGGGFENVHNVTRLGQGIVALRNGRLSVHGSLPVSPIAAVRT